MEIEAKYAVCDAQTAAAIMAEAFWTPYLLEPFVCEDFAAQYLDTPEAEVAALMASVRLRKEGPDVMLTLKWPALSEANQTANEAVSVRGEFNLHLQDEQFQDWQKQALNRTELYAQVPQALVALLQAGTLTPRYTADFVRCHGRFAFGHSVMECAIDRGFLRVAKAEEALSELEIELLEGEAGDLMAFCKILEERYALQAIRLSKFSRLLALEKRSRV